GTFDLNQAYGTSNSVIQNWGSAFSGLSSPFSTQLATLNFTQTGNYLDVTATIDTIALDPFTSVTADSVDVSRTDDVTSSATPGGSGTRYAMTVHNLAFAAGDTAVTVEVDPGTASAFALTDGTHTWFAVDGSDFGVHVVLGSLLNLSASGVRFQLNTRSS